MTQQFTPDWKDEDQGSDETHVRILVSEHNALRELRSKCLDAPITMNQLSEKARELGFGRGDQVSADLANELQAYGLRLKTWAEEAR